jgi:hypothetical protein
MPRAELLDRAIRQRLLEVHAQHAGFPLAEPTIVVARLLCVAEGQVRINGVGVHPVGKVVGESLSVRVVYAAMTFGAKVPWTAALPPIDGVWSVNKVDSIRDCPCLFTRSVRRVFLVPSLTPESMIVFVDVTSCCCCFSSAQNLLLTYLSPCGFDAEHVVKFVSGIFVSAQE